MNRHFSNSDFNAARKRMMFEKKRNIYEKAKHFSTYDHWIDIGIQSCCAK